MTQLKIHIRRKKEHDTPELQPGETFNQYLRRRAHRDIGKNVLDTNHEDEMMEAGRKKKGRKNKACFQVSRLLYSGAVFWSSLIAEYMT